MSTGKNIDKASCPLMLGLFQKRIDGDDALLNLAALRFKEAGLGMECYAENPDELEWLLRFRPFHRAPAAVHLARELDLFEESGLNTVVEFAKRFSGRIFGMVVHDDRRIPERSGEYAERLRRIDTELLSIKEGPMLFIEYAVGLDPDTYISLFKAIRDLKKVSACIDTGHVGIRHARTVYGLKHPGEDVCGLSPEDPRLPGLIGDVQDAVGAASAEVVRVIREIGRLKKHIHFHLHDGHPLSVSSWVGVSDHLGFLDDVPIPFEYQGRKSLPPIFGPEGLRRLASEALKPLAPSLVSITFEVHPKGERLDLGNAAYLFHHWRDKENAEKMNHWLSVITANYNLLMSVCGKEKPVTETGISARSDAMIIYNIFPLLAGKVTKWERHLIRAADLGFTWIFVNPVQLPGKSGSLYSISDYFEINPLIVDPDDPSPPAEQIRSMIAKAESLGLRVMIDLVINHCAADSELLKRHPEWFLWESRGRVAHPFADENGKKVVWKDLAKFDHKNTKDGEGLFQLFFSIVDFLASLGFRGFRCDAAYQVPKNIWERLIRETKQKYPGVLFLAETLGNPPDLTRKTASAGFDFIFNSSKWWDFRSPWLMEQYVLTRDVAPSVSFPESHDTQRLCDELNGNIEGLKQRYLFSSVFSGGVMVPIGFEFGFRKKPHVVRTRPEDWEETEINLAAFISNTNRMKKENTIFQEDAPMSVIPHEDPNILIIWKASTRTREEALIIMNKDIYNRRSFHTDSLRGYIQSGAPLKDVSPEYPMQYIPEPFSYDLWPGQGLVFVTTRDEPVVG